MGQVSTIGLDLAKSIFQAHGADASGAVVFRKRLRRSQVRPFFAAQPPGTIRNFVCVGHVISKNALLKNEGVCFFVNNFTGFA